MPHRLSIRVTSRGTHQRGPLTRLMLSPARSCYRSIAIALLVLALVACDSLSNNLPSDQQTPTTRPGATSTPDPIKSYPHEIGMFNAPNHEAIGVSDGRYALDIGPHRSDTYLKQQASDKMRAGDIGTAISLWRSALDNDPTDAESAIYLENQRMLASGASYLTIVIANSFQQPIPNLSALDTLQGVYLAQKSFNESTSAVKLRLLLAKAGSDTSYAATIAHQIVDIAQNDKTIVGVMGWTGTLRTLNTIGIFANAHLPLVSQTATGDELTGISSYFFRVVPSNVLQGSAGARYAGLTLHATRAVVFINPADNYAQSLARDFEKQFKQDGHTIAKEEFYKENDTKSFPDLILDALNYNPDLIYFPPSNYTDLPFFISDLPVAGRFGRIPVMSGDTAYLREDYTGHHPHFERLHFTSFAYHDEWGALHLPVPSFLKTYAETFDPDGAHAGSYGFGLPDAVAIMSYDAMLALWTGCQRVLSSGKTTVTGEDLRQSLSQITVANPLQGVSGRIAFDNQGNPVNKALVILYIDANGFTQIADIIGCYSSSKCNTAFTQP